MTDAEVLRRAAQIIGARSTKPNSIAVLSTRKALNNLATKIDDERMGK